MILKSILTAFLSLLRNESICFPLKSPINAPSISMKVCYPNFDGYMLKTLGFDLDIRPRQITIIDNCLAPTSVMDSEGRSKVICGMRALTPPYDCHSN